MTDPRRRDVPDRIGGLLWAEQRGTDAAILRLPFETKIETMPGLLRPPEGSASAFPLWEWRRMRDSNPRGREPNPLSKSANRGPVAFEGLRSRLRNDRLDAPGRRQRATTETKTETAPQEPCGRIAAPGSGCATQLVIPAGTTYRTHNRLNRRSACVCHVNHYQDVRPVVPSRR